MIALDINARTNVLSGRKCHCCVLRNVLAANEKLPQNTPQETIEFKNIHYSWLKCQSTGKKSRGNYRKSTKIASRKIMDNRKTAENLSRSDDNFLLRKKYLRSAKKKTRTNYENIEKTYEDFTKTTESYFY